VGRAVGADEHEVASVPRGELLAVIRPTAAEAPTMTDPPAGAHASSTQMACAGSDVHARARRSLQLRRRRLLQEDDDAVGVVLGEHPGAGQHGMARDNALL